MSSELLPSEKDDLSALVKEHLAREKEQEWKGDLFQYCQLLKANPEIAQFAHSRCANAILNAGQYDVSESENEGLRRLYENQTMKIYKFFEGKFFGIEATLYRLMQYLISAQHGGEQSRQILYLVGPPGGGKSSVVIALREALQSSEHIYVIEGCPIREEPLHLVPMKLRDKFQRELGVKIKGDLCPECKRRLISEYNKDYSKVPIVKVDFSKRSGRGMVTVLPVDQNTQDISALIGRVDINNAARYGEKDPRAITFNGAFHRANRGITEMVEIFKNAVDFLYPLLGLSQENEISLPGEFSNLYGNLHIDTFIVTHSNEAEWRAFKNEPKNQAFHDRLHVISCPYNLRVSEEVKIYQKLLKGTTFKAHVAPNTLKTAAMFAVMTRLEPNKKCSLMTKLKLYDGEEVVVQDKTSLMMVSDVREEAKDAREGMSGLSPRYIQKAIEATLMEHPTCINPMQILESLKNSLKPDREENITKENVVLYTSFLTEIRKEYIKKLGEDLLVLASAGHEDHANAIFHKYWDHVDAAVSKLKVVNKQTKEQLEPDMKFIREIETHMGVSETAAPGVRNDFLRKLGTLSKNKQDPDFRSDPALKTAIEKHLRKAIEPLLRIIVDGTVHNREDQEKLDTVLQAMIDNGYCKECSSLVREFYRNNVNRD